MVSPEEWRPVTLAPYEHYQVSSLGRVRNRRTGHILRPQRHRLGYKQVTLYNGADVHTTVTVHRMVAEAFLGPRAGMTVNHQNLDKADNRLANLEYITLSENMRHAIAHGQIGAQRCPPLSQENAAEMRRLRAQGWLLRELCAKYGVSMSCASNICTGKRRRERVEVKW